MAVFNEPQKWAQTLGKDADVTSIPDTAGETDPSIDKIFPSVFSIPLAQGGRAIPRSVLNGLFKLLGDWSFYQQNGGVVSYSADFDYSVGSFVKYNDEFYRCIQANGISTEVKAPTKTAYWSKITTLADVANAFANQDLSNLSASGQAIIDNKADISFSNVNNTANILMAHNAMPSTTSENITVGVSGSTYTAPADGYFIAYGTATASGQYIQLSSGNSMNITIFSTGNSSMRAFLPVRKGAPLLLGYTVAGSIELRFNYAIGAESEA